MEIISTTNLSIEDLPEANARWSKIVKFALTFDPEEMGEYGLHAGDISRIHKDLSIRKLRAHLYCEQRRWNHFNEEPDSVALRQLWQLMEWIRTKLSK